MKKTMMIFAIILGIFSFKTSAQVTLKVNHLKKESGFDRRFILSGDFKNQAILDCQSFIQGILTDLRGKEELIYLEPWECEEIKNRMSSSIRRRESYCLDIEKEDLVLDHYYACGR